MHTLDINADLGESFGAWRMGNDRAVMPHITSANIACGFHAGDPEVMLATLHACREQGVAAGAHPSHPDLQGFGRREMAVSPREAYAFVLYQLSALAGMAKAQGMRLSHLKPHGALYNQAARDPALADAIAQAVQAFDPMLILVGLSGSALPQAGLKHGLKVRHEVFCDRRYCEDGQLLSRCHPGAVLPEDEAIAQAVALAQGEAILTHGGKSRTFLADTLCLHGDRDDAGEFAAKLKSALLHAGVQLACGEHTR